MNYIQYPSFVTTIDGTARVRFDSNEEFVILKSVTATEQWLEFNKPKRNQTEYWFETPSSLDKDFYFEVINNTKVESQLYSDVQIRDKKLYFNTELIKTGRRFEL